jgi:AI-2 transport protein TqsA
MNGERKPGLGARSLLTMASIVLVMAGLRAASSILLPLAVSVFIATMSLPLLFWLRARKVPTAVAVLLVVLGNLALLAGIGFLIGGSATDFVRQLPKYQDRLSDMTRGAMGWLEAHGVRVPDWRLELIDPNAIVSVAQTTLQGVTAVLSNTFLVLIITTFILLEAATLPAKLQKAMEGREFDPGRFAKVTREVQQYVVIKSLISLGTGIAVAIWVAALGVDFPVLWGVVAFVLNYIPAFGSILAAIPAVLLATVDLGIGWAAIVAAGYLVINMVFGNILEPQLMGRRLGLSPLVVLLSLLFWGWLWGPVGMLLSVPLTIIVKILLENTGDLHWIAVLLGPVPAEEALARKKVPEAK